MRLYLDTNVIVDVLERRDPASYDLFMRSLRCQHTLVISSWAMRELMRIGYGTQCDTIMKLLAENKKVIFVTKTRQDEIFARQDTTTHFSDAVHHAIALRSAEGIATWNTRDFRYDDIVVGRPSDF